MGWVVDESGTAEIAFDDGDYHLGLVWYYTTPSRTGFP